MIGLLGALGSACTEFPSIPESGCGNHVIEGTEDCDGFARPGTPDSVCRKPGTVFECHLDCSTDDRGRQKPCPDGWGCDTDAVCRVPRGSFTESSVADDVGAWLLSAADFDGDGRQDVMSSEPLDANGATRLRFNYFDIHGLLAETRLFPKTVLSPTVYRAPAGAPAEVAFTVGQLGVMAGRPDRNWLPAVFSSYRQTNASVRIVGVYDRPVDWSSSFTTLISFADETGFYLGDPDSGALVNRLSVPGTIADLAGDLVSGDVFEDLKHAPCYEPVFAMRGSTSFNVVNACDTRDDGVVTWRDPFEMTKVQLAPPARIDVAPQLIDLNGDGHLDVLLGANDTPYVAYGDGQSLTVAMPLQYPVEDHAFPRGTPLAAGDFSGDGVVDFVFPDRLVVSSTAYLGATPVYQDILNLHTSPWTVAKIADFNGNGKLDVVTASSGGLNLDFYDGTGTKYLSPSLVSTSAPVQFLAAGDVDGDSIIDLSLSEVPPPEQSVSTLKVAFGSAFAPLPTPIAVGKIDRVEALGSYRDAGRDNLTLCSSEMVNGRQWGALTLFSGGPDRVPFAPMTLTEFSSNRSVRDARAFAVVSGHFLNLDRMDVLALAFSRANETPLRINIWSVPAISDLGSSPRRLPGWLDSRLTPVVSTLDDGSYSADVASVAANLDADDFDEAVFAMPADGGSHCGLLVVGADARGSFGSAAQEPIVIDDRCADPQIAAVQFQPGEPPDLVLLTGTSGAPDRHLYVLWNDGDGHFASQNVALVSPTEDSPQAFTVGRFDQGHAAIGYITRKQLRVVHAPTDRVFRAPDNLVDDGTVSDGTGVVAADINGDHLTDVVFSEAGKLRVLKAELTVP